MTAVAFLFGVLWGTQPPYPDEIPQDDGFAPRFPTRVGVTVPDSELPQPERQAKQPAPVAPRAGANPCEGVAPEAQLSCPLTDRVVAIEPISQGVRLVVRKAPPPGQLRAQLVCQLSQATVNPETPPACSFLAPDMNVVVRSEGKSTTAVELLPSPPDEARLGLLREQVQTAFPKASKPAKR